MIPATATASASANFVWSSRRKVRVASVVGVAVSVLGWLYLIYVLATKIFTSKAVPGWTSVTAAVLVLGGAQLVFLGILGQYVGRMYDDVKRRPLFLIADDTRGEARGPG